MTTKKVDEDFSTRDFLENASKDNGGVGIKETVRKVTDPTSDILFEIGASDEVIASRMAELTDIPAKRKKKKKKRILTFATSRDIDIFRTLASGPAARDQIRNDLKQFPSREEGTYDDKETGYSRNMSDGALIGRLSKLKRGGYIISRIYPRSKDNGMGALYVLAPRAIQILAEKHGFNPEHIRNVLPSKDTLSHELQVVSIVKTIKREAGRLIYEYDMKDRNYLMEESQGSKNMHYPDLYVGLTYNAGKEVRIKNMAVTLDNGQTKPHIVAAKARALYDSNKWLSMIICPDSARIDVLRAGFTKYIEAQKEKVDDAERKEEIHKLYYRVFFTTTYNFCEKGFLETKWLMVEEGGIATVVP